MKNRGVLGKLLLLVGISVMAFCAVGIFGIVSNKKIYNSVDRVRLTAEQFQRGALTLTDPLNELRQKTLTMVMAPNRELQESFNEEQKGAHQAVGSHVRDLGSDACQPAGEGSLRRVCVPAGTITATSKM